MKKSILLFTLLLGGFAQANSLSDKKSDYFLYCQLTAADLLKDQGEFKGKSNAAQMASINLSCKFIYDEIEKGKKWNLVKDPKFDGCSDAVRVLIPKGSTEQFEKSQRAKYCAQYLNL